MDIFFFQTFFDNLSSNFIPPLLSNLTYFKIKDFGGDFNLLDQELSIDWKLMGLRIVNATIDPDVPFIQIKDGDFTFQFANLNFNATTDY
mgnify:CR=1 FL=1